MMWHSGKIFVGRYGKFITWIHQKIRGKNSRQGQLQILYILVSIYIAIQDGDYRIKASDWLLTSLAAFCIISITIFKGYF